jgi:hypothetical protein
MQRNGIVLASVALAAVAIIVSAYIFHAQGGPLFDSDLEVVEDVPELPFGHVCRLTRPFLDETDQPVPLPLRLIKLVVGQDAPGFFDASAGLIPLALHLQSLAVVHPDHLRMTDTHRGAADTTV